MRQAIAALFLGLGVLWAGLASAQTVFVQIEAYRDQAGAEGAAREKPDSRRRGVHEPLLHSEGQKTRTRRS